MFSYIYQMIISPITTILEVCYTFLSKTTGNKGLSIIGLSFIVTFCTLPLYIRAEKWEEEERNVQKKLKDGIKRIKEVFKGDEQYMILSTYYKQNHYHPIMALRSSFSLLIQIPFFIAAYNFISHLTPLKGVSFLFIRDFGSPDALFSIGNFSINILPIAMTIINCVSGIIYSKGHPLREKIQIFACAAVFLVLLYDSPAALVLYWTMNNVLSLVKNIFYKMKKPLKVLYIVICIACAFMLFAGIFILKDTKFIYRITFIILSLIIPAIPFIAVYIYNCINKAFTFFDNNIKLRNSIFFTSAFAITILAGLFIPLTLIESETIQFCYVDNYQSPYVFILTTLFQAIGFFIFWPSCFYLLFSSKLKNFLSVCSPIITISAIVNSIIFSGKYGPLQRDLLFMIPQKFFPTTAEFLINTIVLLLIIILTLLFLKRKSTLIRNITTLCIVSLMIINFINLYKINKTYKNLPAPETQTSIEPIYNLSKDKENVIVIMQDRLFIPYVDYILNNHPEISEKFEGFTFYKNTSSFGPLTMIGTPGLFGGYDYTPYEINKRTNQTLQEKHNQALLTMPSLFLNEGWNVTVSDLPYENYLEYPVTDMYKDFPNIKRINVMGTYSDLWYEQHDVPKSQYFSSSIKRNFIWFAFFKMVPPILRFGIYGHEYWRSFNEFEKKSYFIDNYSTLEYLPELFSFNSDKSSFIMWDNELTHDGYLLQAPEFIPVDNVDNSKFNDLYINNTDYHTQFAALYRISLLLEKLKDEDVYDNTKIIIVSDHGIPDLKKEYFKNFTNRPFNPARKTATLLVKDFNSKGDFVTDMSFMTNADTPYLATKDIIENATNPFTGNALKVENKNDYMKISFANGQSTRIRNNTKFTISDNEWATVKDNIFENSNWGLYEEPGN